MKIIVAGNMPESILNELERHGFEPLKTPANKNLMSGLEYHPDMQLAKVGSTYVCDKSLYSFYKDIFTGKNLTLKKGNTQCRSNYPGDIAYNIKVVSDNVFHNFAYTDEMLKLCIEGKKHIHTKQGYSGCSICSAGDNAIITADKIICKKASENGILSLLISPGYIALEGFDYGFIGGASFFFKGKLYFFGNVKCHPDYAKITYFCQTCGTEICQLSDEPLTDYGSAITLD